MPVDYNIFAKSFAKSRKNMNWEEIEYFFSFLTWIDDEILDIGCGSGRFLELYRKCFWHLPHKYLWVDLSQWLLDEAKKMFPDQKFIQWNMLDINWIIEEESFNNIFLIASFHHLENIEDRVKVLQQLKHILKNNGKIYMTNWALESPLNYERYVSDAIEGSRNTFWSQDFTIYFWNSPRYYHGFSLWELQYLAEKSGFKVWENKLFDTQKNFITIFKK